MTATRRRAVLAGAASLPLFALRTRPAGAAEFSYKLANNVPATHPLALRQVEAATRIRTASGGRLDIQVFPASQLGSDTDSLSQLRAGAIELFTLSGVILATLVPTAAISGVGFAFKTYDAVWRAMDGRLGALIRSEIDKRGLFAFDRMFDNGYRQITSSTRGIYTPQDLRGFKIRVPVSPLWTSLFQAFGAAPASINFSELYSALQTKVVEGQENPLSLIEITRLYEVQSSVSLTSHMWDGFWLLANRDAYEALPDDLRQIAAREFAQAALDERADIAKLNTVAAERLQAKGMQFIAVNPTTFRDSLRKAGFYADWRKKFGEPAWNALETEVGALA